VKDGTRKLHGFDATITSEDAHATIQQARQFLKEAGTFMASGSSTTRPGG
jgi:hypothetical protein